MTTKGRREPVDGHGTVRSAGSRRLLLLDDATSASLPSRGQVAVTATIDGSRAETVIEPDGQRGHWIPLDERWPGVLDHEDGDQLPVHLVPCEEWPEPVVPEDLATALEEAEAAIGQQWQDITPMARWEWVRWVGATRSEATRAKRVGVAVDKLRKGSRRPCCFDLSSCTDPDLARSGKLRLDP